MTRHFSSFELDVHFADGSPNGEVADHVAKCERCTAYLKELRALDAQPHVRLDPRPLTGALAAPPNEERSRQDALEYERSRRRILAPVAGALAMAAAVALYLHGRDATDQPYVGVKGAPSIQVLVRGKDGTRVWDGRSPVHPGDAIALHVACEQLTQFTVATDSAEAHRFSEGTCPQAPTTLPFTLVVDDQPGHEHFVVVLSRAPLDDRALQHAVRARTRDEGMWVTAFDFPKEAP
jgi:hypothetical protein